MYNLFDIILEAIWSLEISYKGGAVFLDIAVWLIVVILVIAIFCGYDITLTKK
jgi:hypothetical protein